MTQKLRKIILLFMLTGGLVILADNPPQSLRIAKTSGSDLFDLSSIQEITFSNGNMIVKDNVNSITSFILLNITNMTFEQSTTTNIENIQNVKLYHSLTDNLLSLRFIDDIENPYKVTLYNTSGVVLLIQKWTVGQSISIPVGSFPAGVYICTLKSEKNVYNFRFIKK
jgi:hypothetical protein